MKSIKLEAPAKINLTLDVLGKRADGYHELETVMHQINLVDYITIEKINKGIEISSDSKYIPTNYENLAYKAAELVFEKYGINKEGVKIFIQKNIPIGAGLAGGSTNAAAVLKGINILFNLGLLESELLELGAAIGSDVPFCIMGKTALARGRGEILQSLDDGEKLQLLLIKPDYQVSTAEVYKNFDINKSFNSPDNFAFIQAWTNGNIINISRNIANVLESVTIVKYPEISIIKTDLIRNGALNALMSGSGPTVFGIFNDKNNLNNAYNFFKKKYNEVFQVTSY